MQRRQTDKTTVKQPKPWLDTIDLEMIFVNAIVICVLLLTIVASDILMS
jgi:hypothetical protein